PDSVACRAARDESGPGSRPRRCAYNGGSVATTISVTACSCSHVARLLPTGCLVVNRTTRPTERRVCAQVRCRGPAGSTQLWRRSANQQTRDHRPVRHERPYVRRGECLTRIDHRSDSPSPRGAQPAARPTAAEQYQGNDVTPAV